jgi:hypothetical protein
LAQASLNTLAPENVAHGADILIQATGPAGTIQTLAEVTALDYKVEDDPMEVPVMGSRRNGTRPGRLKVTGTIKCYFVDEGVFSMWMGSGSVSTTGSASIVYASARTFQRYNIRVGLVGGSLPGISWKNMLFVNVTFDADIATWDMKSSPRARSPSTLKT